jgi:hypothetical protein
MSPLAFLGWTFAVRFPIKSCLGNHQPGLHTWFQPVFVDAAGWVKILVRLGPGDVEATVELQNQTSLNCRANKEEKHMNMNEQINLILRFDFV